MSTNTAEIITPETEENAVSTELLVIEKKSIVQYFQPNGLEPVINRLRQEVAKFTPDISTAAGRKEIANG